jgi:hypothetical protein
MIGTFSGGGIPLAIPGCSPAGNVTRYVVHDDGRLDIIWDSYVDSGAFDFEFRAKWEQREPGRFRVMRDEAHADVEFYPILEGTEWEVIQSPECGESDHLLWHSIDEVFLVNDARYMLDQMTPGALCTATNTNGQCGSVDAGFPVFWCEGTTPVDSCS